MNSHEAPSNASRPMNLTPEVAFESHRDRLLSVIYLRMGPELRARMDAEDVLQEVAIEAIHSWSTLEDHSRVGVWLAVLAKRKIARILRDHVGVAARDPRRERQIKTSLPVADRRSGPATHADRRERLVKLDESLARLTPDYREVILLCRVEGLPAKEVGQLMGGRSENAVYLLLSRALKRLAQELEL